MNETRIQQEGCRQLYQEENWIDWLLGHSHTPKAEQTDMGQHLTECARCRQMVNEWGALLKPLNEEAADMAVMPSERVKRSLRYYVRSRSIVHAVKQRGKWFASAAAAVLLLIGVFSVYRMISDDSSDQRSIYVAHYEPNAVSFMNDPQTASYRITPYHAAGGQGYVWFNYSSMEMLVLLEGLYTSENQVVQAWAVDDSGRANLGLLRHIEGTREHLYFKGEQLANASSIVLTVEPIGGSDFPTTPDAFVFELIGR